MHVLLSFTHFFQLWLSSNSANGNPRNHFIFYQKLGSNTNSIYIKCWNNDVEIYHFALIFGLDLASFYSLIAVKCSNNDAEIILLCYLVFHFALRIWINWNWFWVCRQRNIQRIQGESGSLCFFVPRLLWNVHLCNQSAWHGSMQRIVLWVFLWARHGVWKLWSTLWEDAQKHKIQIIRAHERKGYLRLVFYLLKVVTTKDLRMSLCYSRGIDINVATPDQLKAGFG